ncbi:golgin subfamily A member 6-like protein 1 [Dreissena polymorpha]|uniref:golgin subfamily A member 6-like protein 1 n=1 Tax=Dreissena polymorpha TaxID=45954 RepID=UPI0022651CEC|nr:golgin subfamily A member 6-like protein 1 [Dreissena polymorpha]
MFNLQTEKSTDTGLESLVDADVDIHKQKCKDHTDENQSFYCKKHDICICGRCVFSNHFSCMETMVDLNNVQHDAEHMHNSVSTLQVLDEEIDRIMAEIDENRRLNDKCRSSFEKEINGFHESLVQKLIFLKTNAEKESDNLHKQNADVLDETELKCKEHKLVLRQQIEYLKTLEHKKHYRYLFIEHKRIENNIDSFKDKNLKCRHHNHIKEYEFVRNYELIGEDDNIGRLTIECDGSEEVTEMDVKMASAADEDRKRDKLYAEKAPDEKVNPMRYCLEHEHFHCIHREYGEKLERLQKLEECMQEKDMKISKQEEHICIEKENCESMIRDYEQWTTKLQEELSDSVQQITQLQEELAVSEQKFKQLQEQEKRIIFEKEQSERANRVNERKIKKLQDESAVSEKKIKQLQEQEKNTKWAYERKIESLEEFSRNCLIWCIACWSAFLFYIFLL